MRIDGFVFDVGSFTLCFLEYRPDHSRHDCRVRDKSSPDVLVPVADDLGIIAFKLPPVHVQRTKILFKASSPAGALFIRGSLILHSLVEGFCGVYISREECIPPPHTYLTMCTHSLDIYNPFNKYVLQPPGAESLRHP